MRERKSLMMPRYLTLATEWIMVTFTETRSNRRVKFGIWVGGRENKSLMSRG